VRAERGFTLVETLVALAALAFVAVAAMALVSSGARFAANERERAIASIVADNLMVEILARAEAPDIGQQERILEAGGRRWRALINGEEAGEGLIAVRVRVSLEGAERALAEAATLRESS
jgi:general secretion pathway protein I